jgi:hypothetical protein
MLALLSDGPAPAAGPWFCVYPFGGVPTGAEPLLGSETRKPKLGNMC